MDHQIPALYGATSLRSPPSGAALLAACGCPEGEAPSGRAPLRPEQLAAWGVGVVGENAIVDRWGTVHSTACVSGTSALPIRPPDLARITGKVCPCYTTTAIAVYGPSRTSVRDLASSLRQATEAYPPSRGGGPLAEARAARFGRAMRQSLEGFLAATTVSPALRAGVERCAAWMDTHAQDAARALRRDGVDRLVADLEAEHTIAAAAGAGLVAKRRAALAEAEACFAGVPGGRVFCLFNRTDPYTDAALASVSAVAFAPQSHGLAEVGGAVLPRSLALLLRAQDRFANAIFSPLMVFAAEVPRQLHDPGPACTIAVQLWAGGAAPAAAWSAGLSVSV